MNRLVLYLTLTLLALAAGCASDAPRYGTFMKPDGEARRDTDAARRLNDQAIEHLQADRLEQAESLLLEALSADIFFGPAHNNLGTVYLRQKRYYPAAWEFQYAEKLMPGKAEPANNLGLVYEHVGKLQQAAECYRRAHQIEPDTPEIVGNLARVRLRQNLYDEQTRQLLDQIILKDTRPRWVRWARERRATITDQPDPRTP